MRLALQMTCTLVQVVMSIMGTFQSAYLRITEDCIAPHSVRANTLIIRMCVYWDVTALVIPSL